MHQTISVMVMAEEADLICSASLTIQTSKSPCESPGCAKRDIGCQAAIIDRRRGALKSMS